MPTTYDAPMITSFVSQWLNVGDLDDIMPDPKFKFSALDTETAKRETFHFFCEILSKDLPISSFIDPDFTYTTPGFSHRIYGLGPKGKFVDNQIPLQSSEVGTHSSPQGASPRRDIGAIRCHDGDGERPSIRKRCCAAHGSWKTS